MCGRYGVHVWGRKRVAVVMMRGRERAVVVVMVCGGGGGVWWDHPQLAQLQGANTREFVHPDTSQCM